MPYPKRVPFNVLMTPSERNRLTDLAEYYGTSAGAIIRTCIRNMHYMTLEGHPTCANGSQCFVPHMHPAPVRKP